eukprot:2687280-Amphidinium_carterae.1
MDSDERRRNVRSSALSVAVRERVEASAELPLAVRAALISASLEEEVEIDDLISHAEAVQELGEAAAFCSLTTVIVQVYIADATPCD